MIINRLNSIETFQRWAMLSWAENGLNPLIPPFDLKKGQSPVRVCGRETKQNRGGIERRSRLSIQPALARVVVAKSSHFR